MKKIKCFVVLAAITYCVSACSGSKNSTSGSMGGTSTTPNPSTTTPGQLLPIQHITDDFLMMINIARFKTGDVYLKHCRQFNAGRFIYLPGSCPQENWRKLWTRKF